MRKKAIILDLDNTIYPVSSIGQKLFESLFNLISESGEYSGGFDEIKLEIMRRPFQFVADEFSFSESLKSEGIQLLNDLTFDEKMVPFEGYENIRNITCRKFLVTTGFTKLQNNKINKLEIGQDFEQIFIIDPNHSELTKSDIFRNIMEENKFETDDILVVGDDKNSEIKAAIELGIDWILYDYKSEHFNTESQKVIRNFKELEFHLI